MAAITKFTDDIVSVELRHNHREICKNSNTDIDPSRSVSGNYSLTPYIEIPRDQYFENREMIRKQEYEFYKTRKSELYCYNRRDVKTLCSWVITCPAEIVDQKEKDIFFKETANFLTERYGKENVVSITVHADEGRGVVRDGKTEWVGRDHIHFAFIPVVKINHEKLAKKKKHVKRMDNFAEKISANDRLTRNELKQFYPAYQNHLSANGINAKIYDPNKPKSFNFTVAQLKALSDHGIVIDKGLTVDKLAELLKTKDIDLETFKEQIHETEMNLKEKESELEKSKDQIRELQQKIISMENERKHEKNERSWGENSEWGSSGWESSLEIEKEITW